MQRILERPAPGLWSTRRGACDNAFASIAGDLDFARTQHRAMLGHSTPVGHGRYSIIATPLCSRPRTRVAGERGHDGGAANHSGKDSCESEFLYKETNGTDSQRSKGQLRRANSACPQKIMMNLKRIQGRAAVRYRNPRRSAPRAARPGRRTTMLTKDC